MITIEDGHLCADGERRAIVDPGEYGRGGYRIVGGNYFYFNLDNPDPRFSDLEAIVKLANLALASVGRHHSVAKTSTSSTETCSVDVQIYPDDENTVANVLFDIVDGALRVRRISGIIDTFKTPSGTGVHNTRINYRGDLSIPNVENAINEVINTIKAIK